MSSNSQKFIEQWNSDKKEFQIQTSGSTGLPKTIKLNRSQMCKSAEMTSKAFNLVENNSILINLNTNYVAGMMMLVRALHLNLKYKIISPSSNPYEKIKDYFDFYAFVPLQLQSIIESGKQEYLQKSKAIIVGGAPISSYQEMLFKDTKLPIYSTYGMTETCTHVAIRKIGTHSFIALENVSFEVNDDNCLIIYSPTAVTNPLITNDVVELISETEFIWKGRLDNVINTGGIKIQIEVLEDKISQIFDKHNSDIKFIISSLPDIKLGNKIILIIDKEIKTDQLFKSLNKYEIPKEIFVIKVFPKTETDKIDRIKTLSLIQKSC